MSDAGEPFTMIQLEYMPVIIEAHRNDLHKLFDPASLPPQKPSRRERLGATIVRFGYWVGDQCRDVTSQSSTPVPSQQASA